MQRVFWIACGVSLLWLMIATAAHAQDNLPPDVREAAIADLNNRVPNAGRPVAWTYTSISVDNTNLGCDLAPVGASLNIIRVFVITFTVPNGDTYVYHVTDDAQQVQPCDPKIGFETPTPALPTPTLSAPLNAASYGYVSQTCPADFGERYAATRLTVGQFAYARAGDPVYLRPDPNPASFFTETFNALDLFFILAGPECTQDGSVWWQIEWQGTVGWIQESRLGGYYFVEPITAQELGVIIPPTPSLTPTPTATFTPTNTPTATFTPSMTPTNTFTPTPSPTLTNTPTVTPTFTPTPAIQVPNDRASIDVATITSLTEFGTIEGISVQALDIFGEFAILITDDGLQTYELQYLVPAPLPVDLPDDITALTISRSNIFYANDELIRFAGGEPFSYSEVEGSITNIIANEQGQMAVVDQLDNDESMLQLWTIIPDEWRTPTGLVMLAPQMGTVRALGYSPDGSAIATQDETTVYVLDTVTGDILFSDAVSDCGGVAFLDDNQLLYGDCDGVNLVDIEEEDQTTLIELSDVQDVMVLNEMILVNSAEGVSVYDADGELLHTVSDEAADTVFTAVDGRLVITINDNVLTFWGVR